jgi:hypothetical protein
MGNTTFSGPVRSQNGFQTVSIASGTGTETITATFDAATSVTSLAATTVSATGVVTAKSGSALTAGGAAAFVGTNTANSMGIYFGSGAPTVSAAQGSLYLRSDGSSTSTRAYVNTNGTTGWAAITTAS